MNKKCFVPGCGSRTKAGGKIFFTIPVNMERRIKWFSAIGRENVPRGGGKYYCCQDHFELPGDIDNWLQHELTGTMLRLKTSAVPHKNMKIFKSKENVPSTSSEIPCEFIKIEGRAPSPSPTTIPSSTETCASASVNASGAGEEMQNLRLQIKSEFTDDEFQEDTTLIDPNASEIVKVEIHGDSDNSRPCDPQQSQIYYSPEAKRRRTDDCFAELHEDCTIFAEYVACKMKQFSRLERAVLQHKINNIIFEAELKKLQLEEQNRQNNVESSRNSFSSHNGTPEHHASSGNEFT